MDRCETENLPSDCTARTDGTDGTDGPVRTVCFGCSDRKAGCR